MLLVGCTAIEFAVTAWIVSANDPRTNTFPLQCHNGPPPEASVILSAFLVVKLFSQVSEEEKTCSPLLNPSDVLVYVVCHNRSYRGLPSFKQLIESIAVFFVSHVELMLAVCHQVHFQLIMDLFCPFHLLIPEHSVL